MARQAEMFTNYNQSLIPYADGAIQMVPGASGYVPFDQGCDSGSLELSHSYPRSCHQSKTIENEQYQTAYSRNRRPVLFGLSNVGYFIDIYV